MKTNFRNFSDNQIRIVEDAYRGVIPDEQLDRLLYKREKCEGCDGDGERTYVFPNEDIIPLPCPDCGGSGFTEIYYD